MRVLMQAMYAAVNVMENAASDTEANGWDETPEDLRKAAANLEKAFRAELGLSETAPDTLAALEGLVQALDMQAVVCGDNSEPIVTNATVAARAAIALATGKEK